MSGLLFISFFAGVLTVLAPCILPLLPVIVGGSVAGEGSARRVFVIVLSLGVSVVLFTLLLKVSTAFIAIPQEFWQFFSGGLLILFGLVTLVPWLWDRIPGTQALYVRSNKLIGTGYQQENIWGDILIGAALGPVFSSCSPTYFVILAAVLPAHFWVGVAYLLTYTLGLCIFLFVIALLGQKTLRWLGVVADPNSWIKKVVGIVFIVVGLGIIFGLDKKLEAALPAGAYGEVSLEQQLLSSGNASSATSAPASTPGGTFLSAAEKASRYSKAPELQGIAGYINTGGQPINLAQYVGKKVVLVDFWDYTCINCQRTLPYLNAWYTKYKDQGLVIVGVHTPEFAFEQTQSNVEAAVKQFGIEYPVVLDNHYQTWGAFQNEYWPREYLIDIDGYIVHDHAGEGDYDGTEAAIQAALAERSARLGTGPVATSTIDVSQQDLSGIQSPETYFGSDRNEYLGNGTQGRAGTQVFTLPASPAPNMLYLGGTWNIASQYAEGGSGNTILYYYNARDVYMVAATNGSPATIEVLLDGKPVGTTAGADVDPKTSTAHITEDRLYRLIHEPTPGPHTLQIRITSGTLDAYTFTFG